MALTDFGAVPANSVLPVFFSSHDAATGANEAASNIATGDILIFKGTSMTQRSVTNGLVLLDTDGIDLDGMVGINGFSIDLSDNTDAGFYAVGSFYNVVLGPITIDTQTVNVHVATFRIVAAESSAGTPVAEVTRWLGQALAAVTVNGVPEVDVTHWLGTAAATPTVAGVPEVDLTHVAGSTTSVSTLASSIATLLADIGGIATAAADGDPTNTDLLFAYIKQLINILIGTTGIVTFPAAASAANNVSMAEVLRAVAERLGTPSDLGGGATVAANLSDIEAQTDDIGAAGAGLTAADDAMITAIAGLDTKIDTIDNFLDTEMPALTAAVQGLMLASGTIGAVANDTTHLHLTGLAYADDAINSMLITILDVSTGLYYSRWIEDFANAGDLATVATLPFTPQDSTDKYWILPVRADVTGGSGLDAAGVRAAVGLASANLDTQLGDLPTNAELATALGTADDAVLAAIAALNNLSLANVRTGVLSSVVEGAETLQDQMRLFRAALVGKASGLATTSAKYRDAADSKDRITATVDADGNRTAIVADAT